MSLSLSLCVCVSAVCFGNYHHASVSGVIWMDVFAVHSRAITATQQAGEKESGGPAVKSRFHLNELQTCSHLLCSPSTPQRPEERHLKHSKSYKGCLCGSKLLS